MDTEVEYEFETEQQFLDELDKTLSNSCDTHDLIDDALRSYLALITWSQERFVDSEYDLSHYTQKLRDSSLFAEHAAYVRRQFVHCLLQEDDVHILSISTSFLLNDARMNENTLDLLNTEGLFPRLVSLISSPKDEEEGLHRLLMELLYEMARIQKIKLDDLACIDDDFVHYLFDIIEQVSDDVNDPYHYPVIRVLLVVNEQFMVAAHDPDHAKVATLLTNKVIKVLSGHGSRYKTFGENIILLLNREDETSLQLLTLKLLYLLFTTPPTYEYFYTNDLRVLVDILVRNLLDLPEDASALRHTYLRVLYPLLEHTQLQYPPHYKRDEIQKLLAVLGGGQILHHQQNGQSIISHFEETDETTRRLVRRCRGVSWLSDPEMEPSIQSESPTDDAGSAPASPVSPTKSQPPALPLPRKLKKRNSSKSSTLTIGQYLTPQLESARQSSLSMMEMAAQREKPGVITPSRNPSMKHGLRAAILNKKEKPPLPKARRSGWHIMKTQDDTSKNHAEDVKDVQSKEENESEIQHVEEEGKTEKQEPEISTNKLEEESENKDHISNATTGITTTAKTHKQPPPPAPKARRWRGKRAKEEDEGGGTGEKREPGKFNTNLPSITTTSTDKTVEVSPFSPVSPSSGQEKESVSQALSQAQSQAQTQVQALDSVSIPFQISEVEPSIKEEKDEEEEKVDETKVETEKVTTTNGIENDPDPNPDLDPKSDNPPQEPPNHHINPDHNHLPPRPPPHTHPSQPKTQTPTILAPPGQAPPRSIPAPQWEIERSPFLSETESDSENDNDNDNGNEIDNNDGKEDKLE